MKSHELRELGRSQYVPSGRVDWARTRPRIGVGISGGIAIAAAMWYLQSIGHSYIIMNAVLAAFGLWIIARWVVMAGHCRSPRIAMLIGLAIGLSTIVGFYQTQLIELGGWQMAYRIDLIPHLIWHSWNTLVFKFDKDVGGVFEFQFVGNVVVFCVESLLLLGMPAGGGELAARQVYSEETRRWAKTRLLIAQPEFALEFDRALWNDQLGEYLSQVQRLEIPNPQKPPPRSTLVLYFFEDDPTTGYLSVRYIGMFTMLIVDQLRLSQDEYDACRRLIARW